MEALDAESAIEGPALSVMGGRVGRRRLRVHPRRHECDDDRCHQADLAPREADTSSPGGEHVSKCYTGIVCGGIT